ncbi:MAG TPA: hypothetical protein VHU41_09485, partial [Thermoanaerobaculia bacterium]|nr:hypothetical protein [Thermoanaerobaculia bacterium]
MTNDFPAGTSFNSITVLGGSSTLAGNAIVLVSGLSIQANAVAISIPIVLGGSQTWTMSGGLVDSGDVGLNGFTLTFNVTTPAPVAIIGVISGSGAI